MPWTCSCGLINASANKHCAGINHFTTEEHRQITPSDYDSSLYWTAERRIKELTTNEDKFANFFNAEAVLVASMTEIELMEHISELEEIAFEAKARLVSAKTAQRDRNAKKKSSEWTISPTQPDASVTDTINRVKLREKRMTKLDKTRQKLEALGLSDKDVDQMINKMIQQAKKDKPEDGDNSQATAKPIIKPISPVVTPSESKPLDLSKLNFKK